jgi:hypothetical protein
MSVITAIVDSAVRAANVPMSGVRLTDPLNRASWTVQFLPSATAQDRTNAQTVLDTVDVSAAAIADFEAVSDADQKVLRAVVVGIWEAIPNPLLTKVQLRNRILAIYKTLVG